MRLGEDHLPALPVGVIDVAPAVSLQNHPIPRHDHLSAEHAWRSHTQASVRPVHFLDRDHVNGSQRNPKPLGQPLASSGNGRAACGRFQCRRAKPRLERRRRFGRRQDVGAQHDHLKRRSSFGQLPGRGQRRLDGRFRGRCGRRRSAASSRRGRGSAAGRRQGAHQNTGHACHARSYVHLTLETTAQVTGFPLGMQC